MILWESRSRVRFKADATELAPKQTVASPRSTGPCGVPSEGFALLGQLTLVRLWSGGFEYSERDDGWAVVARLAELVLGCDLGRCRDCRQSGFLRTGQAEVVHPFALRR